MGVMVRHKMQQLDKEITAEVTAALQSHQTWQETETEPLGPLAAAAYAWPILNKTYFLWLPSLPGCHETFKNLIKGDILNYIVQINGKKTYRTGRLFIHLCTDLSLSFLLFKMGIKIAPASGNCHEVLKKQFIQQTHIVPWPDTDLSSLPMFTHSIHILVSYSCSNKLAHTGCLKTIEMFSPSFGS